MRKIVSLVVCIVLLMGLTGCHDAALEGGAAVSSDAQPDSSDAESNPSDAAPTEPTAWMKMATYNVANCNGGKDLENIASYLVENKVDICGLQEIDINAKRSKGQDQPVELAQKMTELSGTTYYWAFCYSLRDSSDRYSGAKQSQYGVAIVSRYPIVSTRRVQLWADGQTAQLQSLRGKTYEGRVLLIAEINVEGKIFTVINTHLDLHLDARLKAVETIKNELSQITTPVILLGDLNCRVDSDEIKALSEVLCVTADVTSEEGPIPTYSSTKPSSTIDWIFISKNLWYKDLYVSQVQYSDHMPCVVSLGY